MVLPVGGTSGAQAAAFSYADLRSAVLSSTQLTMNFRGKVLLTPSPWYPTDLGIHRPLPQITCI
jgi:hypothetical protein